MSFPLLICSKASSGSTVRQAHYERVKLPRVSSDGFQFAARIISLDLVGNVLEAISEWVMNPLTNVSTRATAARVPVSSAR